MEIKTAFVDEQLLYASALTSILSCTRMSDLVYLPDSDSTLNNKHGSLQVLQAVVASDLSPVATDRSASPASGFLLSAVH